MDLINLALQFRDYEWTRELLELENSVQAPTSIVEESVKLYTEESVALENITNTYAVREENGVRAFNINSEYDRNLSDLVMVEHSSYRKGEKVKYRNPSNEEMIFARGIANGYVLGYNEAINNLNNQFMDYFNSVESQTVKKKADVGVKKKRTAKQSKARNTKE